MMHKHFLVKPKVIHTSNIGEKFSLISSIMVLK